MVGFRVATDCFGCRKAGLGVDTRKDFQSIREDSRVDTDVCFPSVLDVEGPAGRRRVRGL